MAISVPASKIDAAQVTAMRIALRTKLLTSVQTIVGQSTVIRDLAAYDISGVAAATALYSRLNNKTALTARTWDVNDLGFTTLALNRAVGIMGYTVLSPTPLIDAVALTLGGVVTLAQFWLAPVYGDEYSSTIYFNPPVVFAPGQLIGVNLLSESAVAAAAESYAFYGYTAETGALTVLPDQSGLV